MIHGWFLFDFCLIDDDDDDDDDDDGDDGDDDEESKSKAVSDERNIEAVFLPHLYLGVIGKFEDMAG